jgi:uncharacterized glyoxalase superfamily protein PhnB
MAVEAIPDGYTAVTPWIIARNAAALIDYLKRAFDAQEIARVPNPDGSIGHAEVRIGGAAVMLFDARAGWPRTPSFLRLYVQDGDAVYRRALEAGGASVTEMTDLFFGDRVGRVRDPEGNLWWIQTHLEDVPVEALGERAAQPRFSEAMAHVQESLDRELTARKST